MKKTLTINLGGIVFHIDEDAYISLNQYLEALKKHFSGEEGREDILNDIESRIAEILNEKRSETKQVVTITDIKEVIAVMGQPVEIDQEDEGKARHGSYANEKGAKRFFRNPEEKVIAGVCSGIAAYFNMDPVWVRLIFVIFTAAGGSGVLLYLILWIVIPEAQTTAERLVMRGKKVNISNIRHSMQAGAAEVGSRIGSMAGESAASIRRAGTGAGPLFETIGKGVAEILKVAGRIIIILTGIILILFGLGMLIALLAYTLGWTGGIYSDNDFTVFSFPSLAKLLVGCNIPVTYLQATLIMVLGIPLFMLFYNGLRMVFRFERIRHLGLTMFNIWVVGMFFLAWSSLRIYNLYKIVDEKRIEIAMENPAADTLFITLFPDDPGIRYLNNEQYNLLGDWKTIITGDKELYVLPKIRIEESPDSLFSITQITMARGKSKAEAHQHLTDIRFQSATAGSTLKISPFLRLPGESCWRGQIADVNIRIPRGKFIHIDPQFKVLKPFWYFMMNSSAGSTFQMKEYGIEPAP